MHVVRGVVELAQAQPVRYDRFAAFGAVTDDVGYYLDVGPAPEEPGGDGLVPPHVHDDQRGRRRCTYVSRRALLNSKAQERGPCLPLTRTYCVCTLTPDQGVVMPTAAAKSERLNVRLSLEALETIREAASVQQQDTTSFVLGAALERARGVLAEDRLLRLTPHEVNQLEQALDREPEVVPQLAALLRRHGVEAERRHSVGH